MVDGGTGGTVILKHDTAAVLTTTSTGVDITGTITSDGLTVDGSNARVNLGGIVGVQAANNTFAATDNAYFDGAWKYKTTNAAVALAAVRGNQVFRVRSAPSGTADTAITWQEKLLVNNNGDISFYEDTGTTPKFFWDASAESLAVGGSSGYTAAKITGVQQSDTAGVLSIGLGAGGGTAQGFRLTSSNAIAFDRYNAGWFESMRIDSSGNLLVGTTDTAPYVSSTETGVVLRNAFGLVGASRDSGASAIFNRLNLDGNIAEFRKDGTTVGSIGYESSGSYIDGETGHSGLSFGGNSVVPRDSGARTDNLVDLGSTAHRFKDLYLSGGVSNPSGSLTFDTTGGEAMRIDSSGNLLVGKTSTSSTGAGIVMQSNGLTLITRDNATPASIRRNTSDGDLLTFSKDGSTVGSIGTGGGRLSITSDNGSTGGGLRFSSIWIAPTDRLGALSDNTHDCGTATVRFDDVYATNGTIQTSDRNEKQDIEVLSDAETRVAVACKGLLRKFRWQDAVAEKGDDARIHFGIIAQDLQDAFAAEGLDAGRYAMFISSTWWEATETYTDDDGVEQTRTDTYETLEEAPEGATERTRLGVRYPELLAFIIAAI
jgi:hypothetical protein